ncbi:hypothetical protein BDN67DRAFT_984304 [Paxillus ammoniavirescens]|nr:hypothetical protein BDN67DRAFT_984304 [Paxillus ammoniavirescens]
MAAQQLDVQQQVYAVYWRVRSAITKPILEIECRTDLNFPMHLLSIIIKLKPAANNGTLQGINVAGILPDDPQARQSKVYIKEYTIANNAVIPNLPIGDNRWWDPFHQHYVVALMENAEWEKAEEMKKKGAGSRAKKQGEKQVEKRRQGAEAEDSELVEEDADEEEGNDPNLNAFYHPGIMCHARKYNNKKWSSCVFCRTRKIGCSIVGASPEIKTAKGKVLQSKDALQEQGMRVRPVTKVKRPECSKSIGRPGVAAAEDVQMHSPKGPKAIKAKTKAKQTPPSPDDMDEDMLSGEEPEALQDPSAMQPKGHKVTKAKGKGKARQPSPSAMDEDPSSEESEPLGEVFVPWVDKGKGQDIPLVSGVPGPSAAEVDVVERHTTILVDQLTKQLADMRSWETVSNKMDQMADTEDLEWDRCLTNMDELLRESHARHVALKARLAELEQERMAMTAESAQARMMITNLRSMYTSMSQFLQFNFTVGGPGRVPPSALGGQAGLSQ